jgi:hypothetical protein
LRIFRRSGISPRQTCACRISRSKTHARDNATCSTAWLVTKVESRFDALHQSGTAPLLGRDEELELMIRRWKQANCGEGRVVVSVSRVC